MSKVSVLQRLAVLVLVNIESNTNVLTLIYLDRSYLLFLPTYSLRFHLWSSPWSVHCYTCVVAKCSGFVSYIEQNFFSVKRQ